MNIVALVVDNEFGDRIDLVHPDFPLWIVESDANFKKLKKLPNRHGSVTWFSGKPGESPEHMCRRIAQSLDQHHNEFAQHPPYNALEVYGLPSGADILASLEDIGFVGQIEEAGTLRLFKLAAESPQY